MSLGIVLKGSEGIVLAADSRVTLNASLARPDGSILSVPVNFDNATKLLTFNGPNTRIGAVTFGDAVIGTSANDLRTAHSFIPEFEVNLPEERLDVEDFSSRLSDFFLGLWNGKMPDPHPGPGMTFVVGGFDCDSVYGSVYEFNIPKSPVPVEKSAGDFGISWGGQGELTGRMLRGYDENLFRIIKQVLPITPEQELQLQAAMSALTLTIPYQVLPLQDCIDLAIFLIKTTTIAQNLSIGIRGVGGAIDVAVITQRDGVKIIQQKELSGESKRTSE